MPDKIEFIVNEGESGLRLDLFLVGRLPQYSRNYLKLLINRKKVSVNSDYVKPHHRINTGEQVTLIMPPVPPQSPRPEPIPLDIIHEDDAIIVINKSPGISVHPVRAEQGGTLVNALLNHCQTLSEIGGILRPGIVHRLDRDTSGVLVVAKNNRSHEILADQFKARIVEKEYRAVVWGTPSLDYGRLLYPLGRSDRNRIKMTVKYEGGRNAHTEYEVINRFSNFTYLRLILKTGRTHQLRVHLSRFGYPILGDKTYGSRALMVSRELNISRQMLHSQQIRIIHPITGKLVKYVAPIPADMNNLLNKLKSNRLN